MSQWEDLVVESSLSYLWALNISKTRLECFISFLFNLTNWFYVNKLCELEWFIWVIIMPSVKCDKDIFSWNVFKPFGFIHSIRICLPTLKTRRNVGDEPILRYPHKTWHILFQTYLYLDKRYHQGIGNNRYSMPNCLNK